MGKSRRLKISIVAIAMCVTALSSVAFAYAFTTSQPFSMTRSVASKWGTVHNDAFANDVIFSGLDISEYQTPSTTDFAKLKKNGVDFVILRARLTFYGSGKRANDSAFLQHYKAAKEAGLLVGVYTFSQAISKAEAKAEAAETVAFLQENDIQPDDLALPIYMDYELFSGGRLTSKNAKTSYVKAFCNTIKAAGYEPGVYANTSFLTGTLNGTALGNLYDVWVAQYYSSCQFTAGTYSKWQFTDCASINGISGGVDADYWYLDPNRTSTDANDIANCTISFTDGTSTYAYTGKNVCPAVTVKQSQASLSGDAESPDEAAELASTVENESSDAELESATDSELNTAELASNTTTLKEGTDYSVYYLKNIKKGTAYVYVKGIGDFKGYRLLTFKIAKSGTTADPTPTPTATPTPTPTATPTPDVTETTATATAKTTSFIYNGKVKKPAVTVKFGDTTVLKESKTGNDYVDLTYTSSKLPGTYYVTATGKGEYAGLTAKAKYKIVVKPTTLTKLTNKKTKFIAYWNTRSSTYVTGYQVKYCSYADMPDEYSMTKKYASYKTAKATIKVNYPGQKYYAKIRTYKTIGTKNYYSAWSSVMSVNVK